MLISEILLKSVDPSIAGIIFSKVSEFKEIASGRRPRALITLGLDLKRHTRDVRYQALPLFSRVH